MRTNIKLFCTALFLAGSMYSWAQVKTIKGQVTDSDGFPVEEAYVYVEGADKGVYTDAEGNYTLQVEQGKNVLVEFIGFDTKTITVGSASNYNVSLSNNDGGAVRIKDIVVTGLGVKKEEKALGYAVQGLDGDDINKAKESNIVNSLSGKIAGVQITNSSGAVGSSSRIVLRGPSSITGNNQPIYIVDGVFINDSNFGSATSSGGVDLQNGVADLNADDIEDISVLKGAAAAAIYGAQASRGVILITTKKGKKSKGLGVTLNSTYTMEKPLMLPSFQNSYGQGNNPFYFEYVDGSNGVGDGVDESWGPALDSGLNFVQWDSYQYGGAATPWVSQPDNIKDFFNTGTTQTNSVGLTHGGESSNVRLSFGNSRQNGIVPFTYLNKYNVSLNGGAQLNDKLSISAGVNYVNTKSNTNEIGYNGANPVQQMLWSARNVNFNKLRDWRSLPLAPATAAYAGTPINWNTKYQSNPFWRLETSKNLQDEDRYIGNAGVTYKFTDWLNVTARTGIDNIASVLKFQVPKLTADFRDGRYQERQRNVRQLTSDLIFNIEKDLTDNLSLTAMLGGTMRENKTDVMYGTVTALEIPGLFNLGNPKSGTNAIISQAYYKDRTNSVYGSVELGYDKFLYITATGRNDWASVLPVDNNSFFYPSIGGSFVASEFLKGVKAIDLLKFRATVAKVGGYGPLGAYTTNNTYALLTQPFGSVTVGDFPVRITDPNIGPEAQKSYEFGLDLQMFRNRINLSATYYREKGEDLIIPLQVSTSSGVKRVFSNAAEMTNKGIEITLSAEAVKTKDFNIGFDFNWATNNNIVDKIGGDDVSVYQLGGHWSLQTQAREGQPYGVLFGTAFERNEDGQIIYQNGLPVYASEQKILGNTQPDWTGGVNTRIRYKNFSMNALLDAKWGGVIHSMTNTWGRYSGVLEESAVGREEGVVGAGVMSDGNGGWVANNVVVDAKLFNQRAFSNSIHESSVFDASYVKLRQVMITYDLPSSLIKATPIKGLSVSLIGRNLAILYKKAPHIDPETGFSNSNGVQGLEFGQIPSVRSIGLNLNVKF